MARFLRGPYRCDRSSGHARETSIPALVCEPPSWTSAARAGDPLASLIRPLIALEPVLPTRTKIDEPRRAHPARRICPDRRFDRQTSREANDSKRPYQAHETAPPSFFRANRRYSMKIVDEGLPEAPARAAMAKVVAPEVEFKAQHRLRASQSRRCAASPYASHDAVDRAANQRIRKNREHEHGDQRFSHVKPA